MLAQFGYNGGITMLLTFLNNRYHFTMMDVALMLLAYAVVLFLVLPVHEFAHAYVAHLCGDAARKDCLTDREGSVAGRPIFRDSGCMRSFPVRLFFPLFPVLFCQKLPCSLSRTVLSECWSGSARVRRLFLLD